MPMSKYVTTVDAERVAIPEGAKYGDAATALGAQFRVYTDPFGPYLYVNGDLAKDGDWVVRFADGRIGAYEPDAFAAAFKPE